MRSLREHTLELDTHANTCVVGRHAFIVERHGRVLNVSRYDPKKGSAKNLEVLNAAITVDNVNTGESHVVIIKKAVHVPNLEHNLLCLMQICMNGAVVNETPFFNFVTQPMMITVQFYKMRPSMNI